MHPLINFIIPMLLAAAPVHAQDEPRRFPAGVVRVSDGDTIVVRTADYEDIKVRLYGIDAPERDQPGGREATAALARLHGQAVEVVEMDVDRYGRIVALLEHQGRSVNLELVRSGHAWLYERYCKAQQICGEIEAAEKEARKAGLGIWAWEPVEPWEWRKKK